MPLVRHFDALDASVDGMVARSRGGRLDAPAHLLASAADRSKLWVAIAIARALADRRNGRRAAVRTVLVVGAESALIHAGVKRLFHRARPEVDLELRFGARRPPSSSFPSGHAASAATAAILLADGWRGSRIPLAVLALGVGWSRVHTGLHHASDVAGGLALGALTAWCVKRVIPLDSRGADE